MTPVTRAFAKTSARCLLVAAVVISGHSTLARATSFAEARAQLHAKADARATVGTTARTTAGTTVGALPQHNQFQAPAAQPHMAGLPIMLRQDITLTGEVVRLGDIFNGLRTQADTPIAKAPKPGRRVVLEARWLAALARKYGVNWQPASRLVSTTLSRAVTVVTTEDMRAEIDAFMQGQSGADIGVKLDRKTGQIAVPAEYGRAIQLDLRRYNPTNGRFVITATINRPDGRAFVTKTLSGTVSEMVSLPVLARSLRPGDIIGAEDLIWQRVPVARIEKTSLRRQEDMIGKAVRRSLRAKDPVRSTDIESVKTVLKNKSITMQVVSGAMTLTARGRALEDGAVGETIRILNSQTNQVVFGTINADGTAWVTVTTAQLGE